jgi:stage V sporulation protein S
METLKVSTQSSPNSVAGAMAWAVRESGAVQVQVVGAGALNQAIKAMAIARGYVAGSGIELVCVPTFADIVIDGQQRTAIRLTIEERTTLRTARAGAAVRSPTPEAPEMTEARGAPRAPGATRMPDARPAPLVLSVTDRSGAR